MAVPPQGSWPEPELVAQQRGDRQSPERRTWLIRLGVAIGAGIAIGAAAGVVTVNKFDPGRAGQPDSLQLMLDSLAQRRASNDPREQRRAADSLDAELRAQRGADSTNLANDPTAVAVPALLNLEEGAARDSIEAAGLTIGTVTFQPSTSPLGAVVGTSPAIGMRVRAGTAVNLVLSNGRPPADSTDSHAATDHSSPS